MPKIEKDPMPDALADLDNRLANLQRSVKNDVVADVGSAKPIGQMMYLAFQVVTELVAGVLTGLIIGFGLDWWLGTKPVFIVIFLIFGSIAGLLNVVRSLMKYLKNETNKVN